MVSCQPAMLPCWSPSGGLSRSSPRVASAHQTRGGRFVPPLVPGLAQCSHSFVPVRTSVSGKGHCGIIVNNTWRPRAMMVAKPCV